MVTDAHMVKEMLTLPVILPRCHEKRPCQQLQKLVIAQHSQNTTMQYKRQTKKLHRHPKKYGVEKQILMFDNLTAGCD